MDVEARPKRPASRRWSSSLTMTPTRTDITIAAPVRTAEAADPDPRSPSSRRWRSCRERSGRWRRARRRGQRAIRRSRANDPSAEGVPEREDAKPLALAGSTRWARNPSMIAPAARGSASKARCRSAGPDATSHARTPPSGIEGAIDRHSITRMRSRRSSRRARTVRDRSARRRRSRSSVSIAVCPAASRGGTSYPRPTWCELPWTRRRSSRIPGSKVE